jgi:hypothetical protein
VSDRDAALDAEIRYSGAIVAELKTRKTTASVSEFLEAIADDERRKDCRALVKMMGRATGARAVMWGSAIVGFGDYHYKGASSQGDWFRVGFSPRKQALTLYLMGGLSHQSALLEKLGKHTTGKGCLYLKRLADVDAEVLQTLITESVRHPMGEKKP